MLILSVATSTAALQTFGNFFCDRTASFTLLQKKVFTYARRQRRPAAVCTECAAILPRKERFATSSEIPPFVPFRRRAALCLESPTTVRELFMATVVQTVQWVFCGVVI